MMNTTPLVVLLLLMLQWTYTSGTGASISTHEAAMHAHALSGYVPPPIGYHYHAHPLYHAAMQRNPMPIGYPGAPYNHLGFHHAYHQPPRPMYNHAIGAMVNPYFTSFIETGSNAASQHAAANVLDFRLLDDLDPRKEYLRWQQQRQAQHEADNMRFRERARSHSSNPAAGGDAGAGGGGGGEEMVSFPEQDWTYKDLKSPPEWLVPKSAQPPGLPTTKPPPVPQMVPPPPPFPPELDNHGPYAGAGSDFSPPAPTYSLPRAPPAALPRWIPWSSYYAPKAEGAGQ